MQVVVQLCLIKLLRQTIARIRGTSQEREQWKKIFQAVAHDFCESMQGREGGKTKREEMHFKDYKLG
jgi:hypothetical protein